MTVDEANQIATNTIGARIPIDVANILRHMIDNDDI